jgi:phage tail sheath gpL-like
MKLLMEMSESLNNKRIQLLSTRGFTGFDYHMSARWTAHRSVKEKTDPAYQYMNYSIGEYGINGTELASSADIEVMLNHGITPMKAMPTERSTIFKAAVVRSITTYHLNEYGKPDYRWLDTAGPVVVDCCAVDARKRWKITIEGNGECDIHRR